MNEGDDALAMHTDSHWWSRRPCLCVAVLAILLSVLMLLLIAKKMVNISILNT